MCICVHQKTWVLWSHLPATRRSFFGPPQPHRHALLTSLSKRIETSPTCKVHQLLTFESYRNKQHQTTLKLPIENSTHFEHVQFVQCLEYVQLDPERGERGGVIRSHSVKCISLKMRKTEDKERERRCKQHGPRIGPCLKGLVAKFTSMQ